VRERSWPPLPRSSTSAWIMMDLPMTECSPDLPETEREGNVKGKTETREAYKGKIERQRDDEQFNKRINDLSLSNALVIGFDVSQIANMADLRAIRRL
jgi:hypothetical protein